MRIVSPGLMLAVLFLAAAGCVRFVPKPLDMVKMADAFEARTLDTPELRAFLETNLGPVSAWPPGPWNFEQLTMAALFLNPKLDVARAELASARAAEITAGARPNPTFGVTPEYNFNAASGVSPWIATIQFDIPIETAGKRGHRLTQARQWSEAATFRLGAVAWEIRSSVRAAWLDLQEAGQRATLLSRQFTAQQRLLAALEMKLSLGAVTAVELAPTRLARARTHTEIAGATVQVEEARARLAAAIGVPLQALPPASALRTELNLDASIPSTEARRRALTSRADLLAALAEYAAVETALQLAIARQYPDLHLGPGYQYDQGDNKWSLGLSAEIPVFDRHQGPIAEAGARRTEAAARVLTLQARIIGDVNQALAVWQGTQARRGAMQELRAAQQARRQSIQAQFDAGAVESLDVLTAETELAGDELFHWEAHVQALRALGALEDAMQFPLTPDLRLNPRRSEP